MGRGLGRDVLVELRGAFVPLEGVETGVLQHYVVTQEAGIEPTPDEAGYHKPLNLHPRTLCEVVHVLQLTSAD